MSTFMNHVEELICRVALQSTAHAQWRLNFTNSRVRLRQLYRLTNFDAFKVTHLIILNGPPAPILNYAHQFSHTMLTKRFIVLLSRSNSVLVRISGLDLSILYSTQTTDVIRKFDIATLIEYILQNVLSNRETFVRLLIDNLSHLFSHECCNLTLGTFRINKFAAPANVLYRCSVNEHHGVVNLYVEFIYSSPWFNVCFKVRTLFVNLPCLPPVPARF